MSTNVFQKEVPKFAGAINGQKARLMLLGAGSSPLMLITQSFQLNFSRNSTRLYTLDGPFTYQVDGRSAGQVGISSIVGSAKAIKAYYDKYGDVCNMPNNLIMLHANQMDCSGVSGVKNSGDFTLQATECLALGLVMGMESQNAILSHQSSLQFNSLKLN